MVAGRIPGAEEQMGDAAILVDPTNHELWSDAVVSILQDKELRSTLVERGKKRAMAVLGRPSLLGKCCVCLTNSRSIGARGLRRKMQ